MYSGFYSAASGMLTQQRNLNTIGNNLINSQTPGYRAERTVVSEFEEHLMYRVEDGRYVPIGNQTQVTAVEDIPVLLDESSIYESGNPYDLAIIGEGYFNINAEGQTFLTRNGCFNIDEEGYLVLDEVGRVQGENGDIFIGGSDFTVDALGNVYDHNGNYSDRLYITAPAEGSEMIRFNTTNFITNEVTRVENATVRQSVYERSNINMNDEYTRLIEAQAAFRSCSTALQMIDTMNAKSAQLASIT